MSDLIANIFQFGKEIEFVGNRLIYKLTYLSDGDPLFAVDSREKFKKQGFIFLYNEDNPGFLVKSKDSNQGGGEYGIKFVPKALAKVNFGDLSLEGEELKVPLDLEMIPGIFRFKGYRKIRKLLTDKSLLETEIREVKPLDENFLESQIKYRIYPGRASALFGINSCLELSL